MKNILDILAEEARERCAEYEKMVPLSRMRECAEKKGSSPSFRDALSKKGLSLIAEVKKASPSKGIIDPVFHFLKIAKEYEEAGADAISCLTEPRRFLGNDEYLRVIADMVSIPVLRKDFIVDEYMLYQAKVLGASAVLLIVRILDEKTLSSFIRLSTELGLDALVECHNREEIDVALRAGAGIIGVNNRDLGDFSVDTSLSEKLSKYIPSSVILVSESGISGKEDAIRALESGADAVLVGEALMRAKDKKSLVRELKG